MKREEILALVDRAMSLRDIPNIGHQMIPALCNTIREMDQENNALKKSVGEYLRALSTANADPLSTELTKRKAQEAYDKLVALAGDPFADCDLY